MLGQGIVPESYHHFARTMTERDLDKFLTGLKRSIQQAVARMPSHQEFLDTYCKPADARSGSTHR
jgi:tryptophan halogenase